MPKTDNSPTSLLALAAGHLPALADVWVSRLLRIRPRRLLILLAFLTDRCNLRCRMCGVYEHADPDPGLELTTEEWKTVIDSAARLGTMIVSFSGGEPLLRPDLYDLIRHADSKGIAVHICTNGTMIDEDRARALQEAGAGTVSVSIESAGPEAHENLRGRDTFARTVRGIRLLREHAPRVRVGINTLITAINFRGMADMIPFAESLGVHQIKFAPIHSNLLHRRKSLEEYAYLIFDDQDLRELDVEIRKLVAAARKTPLQTTSPMFMRGIPDLYRRPRRFRCYAGYAACSVDPRGGLSPCCDMEERISVRTRPLHEIWRDPEFHRLRQRVHNCRRSCWDTTNTELSLRLSLGCLLADIPETLQDLKFYFQGTGIDG